MNVQQPVSSKNSKKDKDRSTLLYVITKLLKANDRKILKVAREKWLVIYEGSLI